MLVNRNSVSFAVIGNIKSCLRKLRQTGKSWNLYSLPLFPPGLWCVMQLVCLVSQDDVPVVHQPSSPADRGDGRVISDQRQGPPAKADAVAASASSSRKGHICEAVDLDVIDGVIVGRVGAHAAPTDGGWVAAWRPADGLSGGGSVGTHHRATMFLVDRRQHGSGRREKRRCWGSEVPSDATSMCQDRSSCTH